MKVLSASNLFECRAEDHYPRIGEGSLVQLRDGRLLGACSRFTGSHDHSFSEILAFEITDGRPTRLRVLHARPDALNQMSVSLERLHNGDIGMVWIVKTDRMHDDIWYSHSHDEGETWSPPVNCSAPLGFPYIVVNNDRLRQLTSGRLVIPADLYPEEPWNFYDLNRTSAPSCLGLIYSDDLGQTWQLSATTRIADDQIIAPHQLPDASLPSWQHFRQFFDRNQEPGVEELADGRLLLYCRTTLGYMYQAYSGDQGKSWSPLQAATDLVTCNGPQSIRRRPGQAELFCLYNDRRHVPYADQERFWHWRTPLSAAVSHDHGASWQKLGDIENEEHNYCYSSILFAGDRIWLTHYQSENTAPDKRRNLASMRLHLLEAGTKLC